MRETTDSPVVLINVFEVPSAKADEVVAAWENARDFLEGRPGLVSAALHRALSGDAARFQLINVAQWRSAEDCQTAMTAMRESGILAKLARIDGLRFTPELYSVIRREK